MSPLFANRYELVAETPNDRRAPVRARDVVFNRVVVLESLGAGFRDDPPARVRLAHCLGVLHGLPTRHLVHYFGVEETDDDTLLVREWVSGFSLLELLLRRRGLGVQECVQLLTPLPEALDQVSGGGLPLPHALLGKVLFAAEEEAVPPSPAEARGEAAAWQLKFDPISTGGLLTGAVEGVTVLAPRPGAVVPGTAVELLGHLLCELLGGRRRADGHFAPLAILGERGNALLRAVKHGDYADCATFWSDFTHAVNLEASVNVLTPRRPCPPPAWEAAGVFAPGAPSEVVRLIPDDAGTVPIHLNARTFFRLGRARYEAHYTTRVQPETDENYARTGRIGRVHVWCEVIAGQAVLRDGNGKTASNNGSWFNGHPLPADPPTPLPGRGVLNLADEYRLQVVPLFYDHLDGCRFNDFAAETVFADSEPENVFSGPPGGVAFIPLDGQKPVCDAVWLFTGIGFGLDRDGRLVWDYYGEGESPGAFLHHNNRFWIKNAALPEGTLAIGGIPVPNRQIAAMTSGQVLRLGSQSYLIQ